MQQRIHGPPLTYSDPTPRRTRSGQAPRRAETRQYDDSYESYDDFDDAPRAGHGHVDLDFVSSGRSASEFDRARRHSGMVRFLKLALPLGGALALAIIAIAYYVSLAVLPDLDIDGASIEQGKLVMNNPTLAGTDGNGRPYSLSAERATQDADNPARVSLVSIKAKMPVSDSAFAHITAATGIYDTAGKTLELGGTIAVDMDDGMTIRLEDASIDIEKGSLRTEKPVVVDTGRARVSAESLTLEDRGKKIIFENRVRMTLQPFDSPTGGETADKETAQ